MQRAKLTTGVEIDYLDVGPRDAPALIFLHGFPESHRTWRHQMAYFSERFRCIAPDQRGYRGSSKPVEVEAYAPDRLIADIFALADACGIDTFTIVGHDWGGVIAWGVALAGRKNGRVSRAIIANAPHPAIFQKLLFESDAQRAASQYIRVFRDTANDQLVRDHGLGPILLKALDWKRAAALEPEVRNGMLTDWQDRDAAFAMLNWYRASPAVVPEMGTDAGPARPLAEFPKLAIPTLVVWATDDTTLLPCNLDGLEEVVADLTVVQVPDCDHFVPWEAPAAVNDAMDAFLARAA